MPGGDRTGSMGMGPMSGRAAGYCAGYGMPGYMNPGFGYGFGAGFRRGRRFGGGGGRGWRHAYWATGLPGWARFGWGGAFPRVEPTPEMERRFLEEEAEALQGRLDEIKKQLERKGT